MSLTDGLVRDINLPGWAEQSIWGYNRLLACYWPPCGATKTQQTSNGGVGTRPHAPDTVVAGGAAPHVP